MRSGRSGASRSRRCERPRHLAIVASVLSRCWRAYKPSGEQGFSSNPPPFWIFGVCSGTFYGPMFTELRTHTACSFGDGAVSPEALARRARLLGYTHLGVSDCADLGGIAKFAVEAMAPTKDPACANVAAHESLGKGDCSVCQRPVQLIVGAELEVDGHPAAFIARTSEGYQNLAALVTLARMGDWGRWEKSEQAKRRGRAGITFDQLA